MTTYIYIRYIYNIIEGLCVGDIFSVIIGDFICFRFINPGLWTRKSVKHSEYRQLVVTCVAKVELDVKIFRGRAAQLLQIFVLHHENCLLYVEMKNFENFENIKNFSIFDISKISKFENFENIEYFRFSRTRKFRKYSVIFVENWSKIGRKRIYFLENEN